MKVDTVDSVLVDTLYKFVRLLKHDVDRQRNSYVRRTEDSAIPVRHHQVIAICKTIGACLCAMLVPEDVYEPIMGTFTHQHLNPSHPSQAPPRGESYGVL